MTLPQNGAKTVREYCACGAPRTSQDNGVTTVTKFRPMTIKHSALQRVNLVLQPCLQFDSLVVAHAISLGVAQTNRFSAFREIRCYPVGVNSPATQPDALSLSGDGALSQEVCHRKNNIRLRSIVCAREAVSRARG